MISLAGRVAVVTGAGKGLGRAYALALAARGAAVLVNNRRHPGEADADTSAARVAAEIRAAGGRAAPDWSDVRDPGSGRAMVEHALASLGGLDIVIANAGTVKPAMFHKESLADFLSVFETSFHGNLYLAHAAWPVLRERGYGRMVLTVSSAAFHGGPGLAAYGASKAAVMALVKSLAAEGASRGLRVNAISPYAVTQMTEAGHPPASRAAFGPEQVAPLACFLASEECDLNGEVIVAGGGGYRRAFTVETATVAAPGADDAKLAALARALAAETSGRAWPGARESFAAFHDEVEHAR